MRRFSFHLLPIAFTLPSAFSLFFWTAQNEALLEWIFFLCIIICVGRLVLWYWLVRPLLQSNEFDLDSIPYICIQVTEQVLLDNSSLFSLPFITSAITVLSNILYFVAVSNFCPLIIASSRSAIH